MPLTPPPGPLWSADAKEPHPSPKRIRSLVRRCANAAARGRTEPGYTLHRLTHFPHNTSPIDTNVSLAPRRYSCRSRCAHAGRPRVSWQTHETVRRILRSAVEILVRSLARNTRQRRQYATHRQVENHHSSSVCVLDVFPRCPVDPAFDHRHEQPTRVGVARRVLGEHVNRLRRHGEDDRGRKHGPSCEHESA